MKRLYKKAGIIALTAIVSTGLFFSKPITASQPVIFSDIPADSWAADSIEFAFQNGLMGGMGVGIFGYGETITRAQFVTILNNMFDWDSEFLSATINFHDVMSDDWFFESVEQAARRGVIDYGDMFYPNQAILRQDMSVMLVRALGYSSLAEQIERNETIAFTDVDSYIGYIIIAHDIGMIGGVGEGLFAPNNTATREQAAAMIARVYERLNAPLQWVHGFYAFASFNQRHLISDMNAVSFGWSQMEWSAETGARLNTTSAGGNPWVIPGGYELIINYPRDNGATAHLNVFMDTAINLNELISSAVYRSQAVTAILHEATRIYEAAGRSPFDGVTINFEGLRGERAREDFNAFLTELSAQMQPLGLSLYVTVHPATIDGIYFDGYDLRTIGQLADRVILMVHDYHPRSLEGFIGTGWQRNAALTPIAEVYRSLRVITNPITGVEDRDKIAVAFSFPNIGWHVDENNLAISPLPVAVSTETVLTRMNQPDTHFGWSETHRNPYIIYTIETGERVFLWYEDSRSVYERLKLTRLFGINSASVWRMGIIPNADAWDVWGNFVR